MKNGIDEYGKPTHDSKNSLITCVVIPSSLLIGLMTKCFKGKSSFDSILRS